MANRSVVNLDHLPALLAHRCVGAMVVSDHCLWIVLYPYGSIAGILPCCDHHHQHKDELQKNCKFGKKVNSNGRSTELKYTELQMEVNRQ